MGFYDFPDCQKCNCPEGIKCDFEGNCQKCNFYVDIKSDFEGNCQKCNIPVGIKSDFKDDCQKYSSQMIYKIVAPSCSVRSCDLI